MDYVTPFINGEHQGKRRRRSHTRPIPLKRSVYEWAAMLCLLMSPLAGMFAFGATRWWAMGPLIVITLFGALLYALRPLFFEDARIRRLPPGMGGVAVFLVFALFQIPFAASSSTARAEWIRLFCYAAAFWAWTGLLFQYKRWRVILSILLFAVTLIAWYAIIQHANETRQVLFVLRPPGYGMRASGTYICPNHFASLLSIMTCAAVALLLYPAAGFVLKALSAYGLLLFLPSLLLTQSRSGWLGAIGGVCVILFLLALRRGRKATLASAIALPAAVALLAAGLWFLSPIVQERVSLAFQYDPRPTVWLGTLDMIADAPIFGHGGGSYRWVYVHYALQALPRFIRYAHNEYLHVLSEYGIVGLLAAGWPAAALIMVMVRATRRATSEKAAAACRLGAGCLAAAMIHAFFDFNLHVHSVTHMLIVMLAVTASQLHVAKELPARPWKNIRRGLLWNGAGGLAIAAVMLLALHIMAVYLMTYRGEQLAEQMQFEQAKKAYRLALRLDPRAWQAWEGLGYVYKTRAFWERDDMYKKQYMAEAEKYYRRADRLNPYDVSARYGLVELMRMEGRFDEALDELDAIIDDVPGYPFYQIRKGLMLRELNRRKEAYETFQKVWEIVRQGSGFEADRETVKENLDLLRETTSRAREKR